MTRYLPFFILAFLLLICTVDVKAQAYDECGFTGPSSPATAPAAPVNPAYPQEGAVVCADGAFPECSSPLDAAGGTDFAGDCGSPSFDFILTDPSNTATTDGGPAIIGVSSDGVLDPAALGLAVGDNVCATGFCYDFPQIVNLINQINGSDSACSALEDQAGAPVCPITIPADLNDLFTIAGTIAGGGDLSVGDVASILPSLEDLNDIPGETFDVPACGLISGADANVADYCMEVVDCSILGSPCAAPVCPIITAITPNATEVCSGDAINVCIDFDVAVDATITVGVNGTASTGAAGGTQICVDVPTDNQTCDPAPLAFMVTADCAGVAIDASAIVLADAQVFPLLEENITAPDCMGEAGSAILTVAGGGIECENIVGTAGVPNVCPDLVDVDAELTYDFTVFDSPCFSGTAGVAPVDCAVVCECPAITGITPDVTEVCSGDAINVCIDFDAAVDATITIDVNGVMADGSAGGMQICVDVPTDNQTCDPAPLTYTVSVDCDGVAIDATGFVLVDAQVFPSLEETITAPDCMGEAGSAILTVAGGGIECENIVGTAGVPNVCPDLVDVDAELTYDFTVFDSPCFSGTAGVAPVDCAVVCECPAITGITPDVTEVCSGDAINVCIDFDAAVDATITIDVNGVMADGSAGGMQICVDVPTDNQTCDPAPLTYTVSVDCDGVAIDATGFVLVDAQVFPSLEETITAPDCMGEAGSAILTVAGGGIECENIVGTAGVPNVCPDLVDVDAELTYDFTVFDSPCFSGTAGTTVDCAVVCECPAITAITPDVTEVCSGDAINVCIDFDASVDETITIDINGVMADGSAGGMQICVDVPTDNQTCDPAPLTYTVSVDCGGVAIDATGFVLVDAQVFPSLEETITAPDCMGEAGSAILTVAGGGIECENIVGTAGVPNVCPDLVDVDAELTYDFTVFDSPCFSGTAGTTVDCAVVCECPAITAITPDVTEVCSGDAINVCIDFDASVDETITIDINGVMADGSAGGMQICVDVPTDNQTCDPAPLTYTVSVDCGGVAIDATGFVLVDAQVFPSLEETITAPDCMGEAGSAILTVAGGGIECENIVGTAGVPNVCPDLVDVDAELTYDFTVFDSPCFSGSAGITVDCAVSCVCDPAIATATAPAAEVPTESTCEADGMTLSGGVIAAPATDCPTGSTLEYSIDAGATWSAMLPTYDQTTAVTVDTRCVCDLDAAVVSMTGTVTTVPGTCETTGTPGNCGIIAGEPSPTTATVCNTELSSVDVTAVFGDPGPAGTPSLVQNYAVTDPATGDLITIASTATLDLSSLDVGGEACVQAIAYTQETLDAITAAVDGVTQFPGSPVPAFGMLDLSGFLNGLNGVFETVGFEFTAADIQEWCETQILTIPFGLLPGGLIPDLVLDLTTVPGLEPDGFCCDLSDDPYCLTVVDCLEMCDAACANDMFIQIESIEIVDPIAVVGETTIIPPSVTDGCAGTGGFDAAPGDSQIEFNITINGFALPEIPIDGGTAGTTAGPWGGFIATGTTDCGGTTTDASSSILEADTATGDDDLTDNASQTFDIAGGTFTACGGNIIITYSVMCGPPDCAAMCANCVACDAVCDPAIAAATAPAAEVPTESTCEADGVTLSGGVIAAPATDCPTGSTLEYSIDAGATWSTTLPTYDQMNAVTVDTRCVCDVDPSIVSMTGTVATVPGMCDAVCEAAAPVISNDGGDCDADPDASGDNTPFVFTEDGSGNMNAPFITEFIVLESAGGAIIGVFPTLAAAETAANDNAANDPNATGENSACIQAINHDGTLEPLITALDAEVTTCLGIGLCALLGPPCPAFTNFEGLFNALAPLLTAAGATADVALIGSLIAGDLSVVGCNPATPVPAFCFVLSDESCVTVAPCNAAVCEIEVVISNFVCDAGADPDDPADDTVTFEYTVNDIGGTGGTWSSDQGDVNVAYGTTVSVGPVPADGTVWVINVNDDGDPAGCTASASQGLTACGPLTDIPTLSEWGLITLALLLMTFGSVKMAVGSVALAGTGSSNIPVPGMSKLQLPFDAAILRKSFTFTGVLAMVGFVICFAVFGTIFIPDVIGALIAGPVFAYLAHLLYILETRKEK